MNKRKAFSAEELFGARRLKKERKKYSAEEKVKQVRRHLIEKVPVSTICQETGITPVMFYRWQDQLFQNGAAAFENKTPQPPTGEHVRRWNHSILGGCLGNPLPVPPAMPGQYSVALAMPASRSEGPPGRAVLPPCVWSPF